MKRTYVVSKTRVTQNGEELWYAHMVGFPNIPVLSERGTFGTKHNALQVAADSMGLTLKEYMAIK